MEERIAAKNSNYVYHVLLRDSRMSGGVYEKNFFPSVSRIELVAMNNGK